MKKNIACFLLFLSLALTVHGQDFPRPGPGPGPRPVPGPRRERNAPNPSQAVMVSQTITVSEAKKLPHDSWVILTGTIVNRLPGGRYYAFRDPSGEIAVEIGPREWRGISVNASNMVTLYGEVKIHRNQVSLKVYAINEVDGTNAGAKQLTASEAKNLPHDSWVVLNGKLSGPGTEDGFYSFRDSSGEIPVEITGRVWRGLSLDENDSVEISGALTIIRRQISIRVYAIRKL